MSKDILAIEVVSRGRLQAAFFFARDRALADCSLFGSSGEAGCVFRSRLSSGPMRRQAAWQRERR
jgi:hypothetical protein